MDRNEVLNKAFSAYCKLELMRTLLEIMIDLADDVNALSVDKNTALVVNQCCKIGDLIHIVFDGVDDALGILEEINGDKEVEA